MKYPSHRFKLTVLKNDASVVDPWSVEVISKQACNFRSQLDTATQTANEYQDFFSSKGYCVLKLPFTGSGAIESGQRAVVYNSKEEELGKFVISKVMSQGRTMVMGLDRDSDE